MTPPFHLNNDSVTNQLLKYRAEQQQKFRAEQQRRQQEAGYSSSTEPETVVNADPETHPAALKSTNGTDSRYGSRQDFSKRPHERFQSEQMEQHQEEVSLLSSRSCSSSEEPRSARSA